MPDSKVRVRFAPSPTGHLHVGNARTALFNWLFARQQNGVMLLRIEDTDIERSEARHEDQLVTDLKWLGLDWDEGPDAGGSFGPYRQSDRLEIYHEHSERLLREGKAYLCFCTPEELEAERHRAIADHRPHVYSGKCRALSPEDSARRRSAGEAAAIRLRIPDRPIKFHDIVHGEVEFPNEVISDPIIMRSTGMPVYNYVVVVDDALMKITHVIRGDDHLSNTPKQVALYEALGWPTPEFAHLSTILGSDRERLSKRHGATSIANFREMGVLPEALVNYLALLGWAPSGGDREIFSRAELIKEFDLKRVTPSPAVFDFNKLYWLNRHYIKEAGVERIAQLAASYFVSAGLLPASPDAATQAWFRRVIELLAPSVDRLGQLTERAALIFDYNAAAAKASADNAETLAWPKTSAVIKAFSQRVLAGPGSLTAERFKAIMNEVKTETGAKGKELFHPVRIVITGSHSGPEFDKLIPILEEGSRLPLPKHVKGVEERVIEMGDREIQKKGWEVQQGRLVAGQLNKTLGTDYLAAASTQEPADVVLTSASGKFGNRFAQVVSVPLDFVSRDDKHTVERVRTGLTLQLQQRGVRHALVGLGLSKEAELKGVTSGLLEQLAETIVAQGLGQGVKLRYNDLYERAPALADAFHFVYVSYHPEIVADVSVEIPHASAVPQDGRWIEEGIRKKVEKYGGQVAVRNLALILGVAGFVDEEQVSAFRHQFAEAELPFAEIWINTPFDGTVCLKAKSIDLGK